MSEDRRMPIDLKTIATLLTLLGMLAAGSMAYGRLNEKVEQNEKAMSTATGLVSDRLDRMEAKTDRIYELVLEMARR